MHSKNKSFQILLLMALSLLALAQLVFLIDIIRETYIAGPVQDSWGIIPYIKQTLSSGNWFNSELWLPQNSHRLVLLRMEFLVDYRYFHGSNYFLLGISSLTIIIEAILLFWLLGIQKKLDLSQWIIFLSAIVVITFPTISWSFLHIFNIHMLQFALLAAVSCALVSKALDEKNTILFIAGIAVAMVSNFASFGISAIWPALILLVILNRTDKYRFITLVVIAIAFSYAYLKWLPITNSNGGNNTVLNTLINNQTPIIATWLSIETVTSLFRYLVVYLSLPPVSHIGQSFFTLFSLGWFALSCIKAIKSPPSQIENTALSFMFFGICLGVTTGIGRGYLGSLATGDRFQPMILIYWTGFIIHILHYLKSCQKIILFNASAFSFFCFIAVSSYTNNLNTGKKLTDDFTRFAKMQMAYITNNLGENAIYENMVAEWRVNSYAGIVQIIPYLQENKLGVFNEAIAEFAQQHASIDAETYNVCLNGTITEKERNNDPLIRNIVVETENVADAHQYPYLLLYIDNKLAGAAFRKRVSLQQKLQNTENNKGIWLGISSIPLQQDKTLVLAFKTESETCLLSVK